MTRFGFVFLWPFLMTMLIMVSGTPFRRHAKRSTGDCDPYPYCNAQSFPRNFVFDGRPVVCDQAVSFRDRCCLPQAKHFVCYNIKVNSEDLNFDTTNNAKSTDFTGLCNAMARSLGKTPGKHSSAVIQNSGGKIVWRYGEFVALVDTAVGTKHVENLACEILN